MEEYTYIRTVGEGAYGYVWLTQKRGGTYCAVKVFKQAHEDPEIKAMAKREARILQTIDHVNCVKILDAFKSKSGRVYLVFEYIEKSIFGELDANPYGLQPRVTKLVAWQLLHATAYLHGRKLMHRDIKPANILMTKDLLVKLCDFGFARTTRCGPRDLQAMSTYCVTRWYRPPEVLVSDQYGPSADIWSIGCTVAEIATGRPLFPGRSTADQLWRIMRCLGPIAPQHLTRMLADERIRGVGVPQLHRTLRQRLPEIEPRLFQLVEACLQVNPACRPTAAELLQMPYFWDVPRLLVGSSLEPLYAEERIIIKPEGAPPLQQHALQQKQLSLPPFLQQQALPAEVQPQSDRERDRGQGKPRWDQACPEPPLEEGQNISNAMTAATGLDQDPIGGRRMVTSRTPDCSGIPLSTVHGGGSPGLPYAHVANPDGEIIPRRMGLSVLDIVAPKLPQLGQQQQAEAHQLVQVGVGSATEDRESNNVANCGPRCRTELRAADIRSSTGIGMGTRSSNSGGGDDDGGGGGGGGVQQEEGETDGWKGERVDSGQEVARSKGGPPRGTEGGAEVGDEPCGPLQESVRSERLPLPEEGGTSHEGAGGTSLRAASNHDPEPQLLAPGTHPSLPPKAGLLRPPPRLPVRCQPEPEGGAPTPPELPAPTEQLLQEDCSQPQMQPLYARPGHVQLDGQNCRNYLRPGPSASCPEALNAADCTSAAPAIPPENAAGLAPGSVIRPHVSAPPSQHVATDIEATDAEEGEQYDDVSELRCTGGHTSRSGGSVASGPLHRPLYQVLLVGGAAEAWQSSPGDGVIGMNNEIANSTASAAITLGSALLAAPDCEGCARGSRTSAMAYLLAEVGRADHNGTCNAARPGGRDRHASDTLLMRLPAESAVATAAMRSAAATQQRTATELSTSHLYELQRQQQTSWAHSQWHNPHRFRRSTRGSTMCGAPPSISSSVRPTMRGSEDGSYGGAAASRLMLQATALADHQGGRGRAGGRPAFFPGQQTLWRPAIPGSSHSSAQQAAAAGRGSYNGSKTSAVGGDGFAFPALPAAARFSNSGALGRLGAGEGGCKSSNSNALSHMDSIPLIDVLTPVGAPDMPLYTVCPLPHRRPPPSQMPWQPPSRGNSDSLSLHRLHLPYRTAVPPLNIMAAATSTGAEAELLQQQQAEADSSLHSRNDLEGVGSGGCGSCGVAGGGSHSGQAGTWAMVFARFGQRGASPPSVAEGSSNRSLLRAHLALRSRLGSTGTWDVGVAGNSAGLPQGPTSGALASAHCVPASSTPPKANFLLRSHGSLSALLSAGVQLSPVDGGTASTGTGTGTGALPLPLSAVVRRDQGRLSARNLERDKSFLSQAPLTPGVTSTAKGTFDVGTRSVGSGVGGSTGIIGIDAAGYPGGCEGAVTHPAGPAAIPPSPAVLEDKAATSISKRTSGFIDKGKEGRKMARGAVRRIWKSVAKVLRLRPSSAPYSDPGRGSSK